mmetsp:Transcript_10227/g.17811  ORF Transcript_10227/g.17811 Transcript_10227/m.17811 type:complete len:81 (+) Transcript_10227:254-496(+)
MWDPTENASAPADKLPSFSLQKTPRKSGNYFLWFAGNKLIWRFPSASGLTSCISISSVGHVSKGCPPIAGPLIFLAVSAL